MYQPKYADAERTMIQRMTAAIRLHRSGVSTINVAKRFGVTRASVYLWLNDPRALTAVDAADPFEVINLQLDRMIEQLDNLRATYNEAEDIVKHLSVVGTANTEKDV